MSRPTHPKRYRTHYTVDPLLPVATRTDVEVDEHGVIQPKPRCPKPKKLFTHDPLLDKTRRKTINSSKRAKSRGTAAQRSIYALVTTKPGTNRPPIDSYDEGHKHVTLRIHRVADPYDEVVRGSYGLVTGLSLQEFLWNLFVVNEELPRHKKLTDETLIHFIAQEFPDSQFGKPQYSHAQRLGILSRCRSRYNCGRMFWQGDVKRGRLPTKRSYRYDIYGLRMLPRTRYKRVSDPNSSDSEATLIVPR